MGYRDSDALTASWGKFGVAVKGYVTFAANLMNTAVSGYSKDAHLGPMNAMLKPFRRRPGKITSTMDILRDDHPPYILDEATFDTEYIGHNELFVTNWKPTAVVLASDLWASVPKFIRKEIIAVAKERGLSVVDESRRSLKVSS